MKKINRTLLFSLLLCSFLAISGISLSQPAPPPPPPSGKGTAGNQGPSGGAPIDGGLVTALVMIAGFGTWKLIRVIRTKAEVS